MTLDEGIRLAVQFATVLFAGFVFMQMWTWHKSNSTFNLMELFTALGKDRKQHISRPALGEMVALYATTSAYLGTLAVKPDLYPEATGIYAGVWAIRGGYGAFLRNKQK